MPGLHSWKTSSKSNTKVPIKKGVFPGIRRLTTSFFILYDSHSVRTSRFPSHLNVMKTISLCEPAKQTCICIKLFNIIFTHWHILINRTNLGLNQNVRKHMALILIVWPTTQHFLRMFHSWTPWIKRSFSTYFSSWLSTFFHSVSTIANYTYDTMSKSNITAYVNSSFTFFKSAYYI